MEAKLSAILLAAGLSLRMGVKKQLLLIHGRPAVTECIENIKGAHITDIVAVINPEGSDIVRILMDMPVKIVVNESKGSDMATSAKVGLDVVDHAATGILVCLCDHPLVCSETMKAMRSEHVRNPDAVIIPTFKGKKGHPTLFPRTVLEDIRKLPTLRDVIRLHYARITLLEVDDEGVILDMDTLNDYEKIEKKHKK